MDADRPPLSSVPDGFMPSLAAALFRELLMEMRAQLKSPKPILTIVDLEERWGICSATIMKHVEHDGLRYLPLGRPGAGPRMRPMYRFRLVDVEQWEAAQVRIREARAGGVPAEPPGRPVGYTGKIYTKTGRTR